MQAFISAEVQALRGRPDVYLEVEVVVDWGNGNVEVGGVDVG